MSVTGCNYGAHPFEATRANAYEREVERLTTPQNAASATKTGLSRPKGSQRGNYATGIPNGPENAKNEGDA